MFEKINWRRFGSGQETLVIMPGDDVTEIVRALTERNFTTSDGLKPYADAGFCHRIGCGIPMYVVKDQGRLHDYAYVDKSKTKLVRLRKSIPSKAKIKEEV